MHEYGLKDRIIRKGAKLELGKCKKRSWLVFPESHYVVVCQNICLRMIATTSIIVKIDRGQIDSAFSPDFR